MNVLEVALTTGMLFMNHKYVGADPPFVGVATNVTASFAQGFPEGTVLAIETEAVTLLLTVVTIVLDVDVLLGELPESTHVRLDTITQCIESPFAGEALLYVLEFVPTLIPFFTH